MHEVKRTEQLTENLKLEKNFSRSNQLVADIIQNMQDGFFVLDRNWQITYINRAGEIALGKSRDELLDKKLTEVFSVNDITLKHYHEVMNEKKSVTFELIPEALGNQWLEISAYPTEAGLTCYFKDISNRKMAEKEFARLDRLKLFKELAFQNEEKADRAAELVIANKELAFQGKEKENRAAEFLTERQLRLSEKNMTRLDRLNLVGQMAAGIAHEIRNPMTTVRGYLQLLGAKPWHAAQKSTFDLMISELDRANMIITEFLSLAQTKPTELKSHDLNDILNNIYPLIEADSFTQNKQICFIPGEIPELELNANEIIQLVLILTRNGLEAMWERGCLNVKSYVEDGKVVLAIEDEGCGIPPENLRKIGTPFFTTKDTGTGLGLATCYKIAESHNAKVEIDSSSRGTTFFMLFPIPEMIA